MNPSNTKRLKELQEAFDMLSRIEDEMMIKTREMAGILDETSLVLKELLQNG